MKKFIVLAVLSVFTALGANAQYRGAYRGSSSRYTTVIPSRRQMGIGYGYNRPYFGLRAGAGFSNITGDDYAGGDMKSGVNAGMALGFPLSGYMPLYLETGASYIEKGENNIKHSSLKTSLGYVEMPLVFKYQHYFDGHASIQPYFGGYAALGVGGKTRDAATKTSTNSFGNNGLFKRWDAGLKLGCGLSYDMFYAEINYDWGLANISKSPYEEAKNSTLTLNLGVNF